MASPPDRGAAGRPRTTARTAATARSGDASSRRRTPPREPVAAEPHPEGAVTLHVERVQSSYLQVAEQLRALILRGELAVGDRLPSEAAMAPQFGVSRSTIREALRILVTDGLVVTKRGVQGGTFVAEFDSARVAAVLRNVFTMLTASRQISPAQWLDAWAAFEAPAARQAAARRGGDLLRELDELSQPLPDDAPSVQRTEQSAGFHLALQAASGNVLFAAMGRPITAAARESMTQVIRDHEFWCTNTREHRAIFDAVAAGDPERADRAAVDHIETLRRYYGA